MHDSQNSETSTIQASEYRLPDSPLISEQTRLVLRAQAARLQTQVNVSVSSDEPGVKTKLHVWEGLEHGFHYNPELPEAEQLHRTTLAFLERCLSQSKSNIKEQS